jgi:putative ABC transport system permease protein
MSLGHWIYKLPLRLRSVFHRDQVENELDEELQYHLDRQIQILIEQGVPPGEARAVALRQMSGLTQQKENCRDARGVGLVEDLISDSRYALRSFLKSPSLVLVIIASLALGIGANTAIFSVMNAISLKMLPVPDPGRLVLLNWSSKAWPEGFIEDLEGNGGRDAGGVLSSNSFASDIYAELKKQNDVFDQTFAFAANDANVNIKVNGTADSAHLQAVSGDFFIGLGISPWLGREFLPADDTPSSAPVAVVSHEFWRKHFGADAGTAEKTVNINGHPVTIVGVAPPEFFGVVPGNPIDIYVPLSLYSQQWTRLYPDDPLTSPKTWWLTIMGRMKPGVTQASARSELQVIFDRALRARSQSTTKPAIPTVTVIPAGRGLNDLRQKFSTSLLLLMGMVGLVLLIACANVAGVLLARATARQKEIAVRLSLGASRSRIIRQLLVESVMLGLVGGFAGILLSFWASSALVRLLSSGRNPLYLPVNVDFRVLIFTCGISILSGLIFGLMPAIAATRVSISPTLKDSAAQFSTRGGRFRIGKALVGGQVALSLLLLIASGLLLRTLDRLQHVTLGFDQHALLTFEVRPGLNAYDDQRLIAYYQELQRRLQSLPGVHSVAFTQHGPIDSGWSSNSGEIPGYTTPGQQVEVYRHIVGPGYFETLNIPIVLGRGVTDRDIATSPRVLVVNETLVHKYFHGDNPLGKQIVYSRNHLGSVGTFEIVGVARDVKYGKIRNEVPPTAYWPYQQPALISRQMVYLVRIEGNPLAIADGVRKVCLDLDKNVPVVHMQTEEAVVTGSLFLERTFALLSSAFGALALLLACVGLYGTIGYAVTRRTGEIGVRMALGAQRGRILRMILSEVSSVVILGILVGLPVSSATARLLNHQLYELSPHDPPTIIGASLAILVITLLAGYVPARRASKVNPVVALRYE